MPRLTIREVLAENELTMDELGEMDYKDVAAHESAALEYAGYNCPDGYNCPRAFGEWLSEQLSAEAQVKEDQIEAAYEQKLAFEEDARRENAKYA